MEGGVKDWTEAYYNLLGASALSDKDRVENDFYATSPLATELLVELEALSHNVWEPCCGQGHIGKVLEAKGFNVTATDLVYRGYGRGGGGLPQVYYSVQRGYRYEPSIRICSRMHH